MTLKGRKVMTREVTMVCKIVQNVADQLKIHTLTQGRLRTKKLHLRKTNKILNKALSKFLKTTQQMLRKTR